MAQSGFTPIQQYRSATPAATPSTGNLAVGEFALNYADGNLFFKDTSNTVRLLASAAAAAGTFAGPITAGNANGVALFMADSSAIRNTASAGNTMYFDSGVGAGSTTGDFHFRATASFATRLYIRGVDGNVGIGTTSPAQKLTVAASTNQLSLTTGTNELIARASSSEVALYTFQALPMNFYTNNAERMRIDASGNVGIGTTSPVSKLDVSSSGFNIVASRSTGGYAAFHRFAPSGQAAYDFYTINGVEAGRITVDGLNYMAFSTGSAATERMRITDNGNVGIGTSNPEGLLDVTGNTILRGGANGFALFAPKPGTSPVGANYDRFWIRVDPSDQVTTIGNTHGGTGSPRALAFLAANTERMRIDTAGNVGVGETAPDYKLDVNGTFGFTPGASVTPVDNGDVVFELTNNTTLTIKAKGSDGVVRSGTITLA